MKNFKASSLFFSLILTTLFILPSQAQPLRQWVAHYNGPANSSDVVTSMVVDDSGSIIVTGWSNGVGTGADIATIKYNADGVAQWIQRYNGTGAGEDKPVKVVVDTAENVYVTGWSNGTGLDIVTIKYDKAGVQQWLVKFIGTGDDKPSSIQVDDSMNVYVTGSTVSSGSGLDIVTLKYNSAGILIWSKIYNGSGNSNDYPVYLKLESYNYCYIGGVAKGSDNDFLVIKYNSRTSDTVWTRLFKRTDGAEDILKAMVWRDADELYLTGTTNTGTGNDILTMRVNGITGDTVWTQVYNGTASGDDVPFGIALHSNSRVYITGRSVSFGSYYDIITLRYDQSDGDLIFETHYNGPANDEDVGYAILGGGSPHIVGSSFGINSGRDIVFLEVEADGDISWQLRFNGIMNNDDVGLVLDDYKDTYYIAGSTLMKKGTPDFLLIKYVKEDLMKYRTITQNDLLLKGVSLKPYNSTGNFGNLRDSAFARAFPKIKKDYAGAPGGMVLGIARTDSPNICGWIRFKAGKDLMKFAPHTGAARGFDIAKGVPFFKELKSPKLIDHNNKLAGELATLKINIGASDAEITPIGLGDLIFNNGDTSYHYNGYTVRQLALVVDNFLSYYRNYSGVDWARFDTMLTKINSAFSGPYAQVSQSPLMVSGAALLDTIPFLQKNPLAIQMRLEFKPEMLDETPNEFALYQNYPNPFNPSTTIKFTLPSAGLATMKIYDILGREVATLLEQEELDEGEQSIDFFADNLSSGIYFYRLVVNNGEFQQIKKMMFVK
ncbi:MAG: T9SS type A sorting domain-containing protein [Bacteroidota bacterium]|nr:T9SS type A sorting domain-containing protein [Bacteroidota bacterium]